MENANEKSRLSVSVEHLSRLSIRFKIRHCTVSLANALRRVMMSDVPCLAVDSVEWEKNNTVVFHEFQERVFALTALACDDAIDSMTMADRCKCGEFCSDCSIRLSLRVKNTSSTCDLDVTNRDLLCSDSRILPISDVILLNKLKPGQEIAFSAVARKGSQDNFLFNLNNN